MTELPPKLISDAARRLVDSREAWAAPAFVVELTDIGGIRYSELFSGIEVIPMPAETCWLETIYHDSQTQCASFCKRIGKSEISITPFVNTKDGRVVRAPLVGLVDVARDGAEMAVRFDCILRGYTLSDNNYTFMKLSAATLAALARQSIADGSGHLPSVINRARCARRGVPTYRYYLCDLSRTVTRCAGGSRGGTHASPAEHLRRGHHRRLKSGRVVFVRSCIVGSRANGIVAKDYLAGGETLH